MGPHKNHSTPPSLVHQDFPFFYLKPKSLLLKMMPIEIYYQEW